MDEMELQEGADGGFLSRNSELELLQWGLGLHLRLFLSVLFVGLLGSTIDSQFQRTQRYTVTQRKRQRKE